MSRPSRYAETVNALHSPFQRIEKVASFLEPLKAACDKIYIFFDKIYIEMQIFICYIIIVKYELVFT